jgi:hypothetical protein
VICAHLIRCIFSWVNFDRIGKSCRCQFQNVVQWSPWPYPCVTCGKEEFFFCDGGRPTEGRQLIVYESRPPLPFKGSCYVLVLVSAGVCNALVATTVGLLTHLVYHHNSDYNATNVLYTYTDSCIVGPGSICWQSGVCGGHSGAVLALVSDHPHPVLDTITHAISHQNLIHFQDTQSTTMYSDRTC